MSCCRCCRPLIPIFEFDITGDILFPNRDNNSGIKIPIEPETDINKLKLKIICDFLGILDDLEAGREVNLEFLLEEISAVELESEIDKREFIIQYYLNNTIWKENTQ